MDNRLSLQQKIGIYFIALGILGTVWRMLDGIIPSNIVPTWFALIFDITFGAILFIIPIYKGKSAGVKNNGVWFKAISARGWFSYLIAGSIMVLYVMLYWFPTYLGSHTDQENTGIVACFDSLSYAMRHSAADQWFVYGVFYTLAVLLLGAKFIWKYKGNRYQIIRTISVMFFQLGFAFIIPAFMEMMNQPHFYFHYFWPLDNYALRPDWFANLYHHPSGIGLMLIIFSIAMLVIVTPILTFFYGKRWYCSWVCGCGALAETAGDSFRQLSDKSTKAWKIERWMIYSVLIMVIILTVSLWVNSATQGGMLGSFSNSYSKFYGFFIGSMFSGVVGTGFYPIFGSRVWCRFGCPMAAILGIQQKFFSRFRITTNGGQCISCGNCSTYCEMGIDVRAYAQKGQNIVRASCVGCGVCSSVCPRGVLKLENGPHQNRVSDQPILIGKNEAKLNL